MVQYSKDTCEKKRLRKKRLRMESLGTESLRKERLRKWQLEQGPALDAQEEVRERILPLATSAVKPTSSRLVHGYATKEGCRTERKSRNLEYTMGVRLTGFTT
jgi:hypothetical protein